MPAQNEADFALDAAFDEIIDAVKLEFNATVREMTTTLTRTSLADYLAGELENTYGSRNFSPGVFEEIARCLEAGYQVKLSGFGNFVLLDKKARPGRNPKLVFLL